MTERPRPATINNHPVTWDPFGAAFVKVAVDERTLTDHARAVLGAQLYGWVPATNVRVDGTMVPETYLGDLVNTAVWVSPLATSQHTKLPADSLRIIP